MLKHVVGPTAAFVETTTLTATAAVGTTETDSWVDKDLLANFPPRSEGVKILVVGMGASSGLRNRL